MQILSRSDAATYSQVSHHLLGCSMLTVTVRIGVFVLRSQTHTYFFFFPYYSAYAHPTSDASSFITVDGVAIAVIAAE